MTKDVIGYIPLTTPTDDISALQAYGIRTVSMNDSTYLVDWGAAIVKPDGTGTPMLFSMLILRSPTSGSILTLIDKTATTNAGNMRTFC